jgi:hypothetical protein
MQIHKHAGIGTVVAAFAAILLAKAPAMGQIGTPAGNDAVKPPANIKVGNRALQRTAFQVTTDNVVSSCNTADCLSPRKAMFVRTAQCDGAAGKTCTFYLHIDAQVALTGQDQALFEFFVDGAPPTPGPTGLNGLVNVGGAGDSEYQTRSFGVVAYVTNKTLNQQHNIEIDILCEDFNGDGCMGQTGFASLQAVVYTP